MAPELMRPMRCLGCQGALAKLHDRHSFRILRKFSSLQVWIYLTNQRQRDADDFVALPPSRRVSRLDEPAMMKRRTAGGACFKHVRHGTVLYSYS